MDRTCCKLLQIPWKLQWKMTGSNSKTVAHTVEMAVSSSKMLQIAWKNGENRKFFKKIPKLKKKKSPNNLLPIYFFVYPIWSNIQQQGSSWEDFFLTTGKIIPLGLKDIYSAPILAFSKFRGVVPWKNIQRHWGCSQRKMWSFSERSWLQRDKQVLGHWNFIPEMFAPMVPKLILDIFGVPCAPGGCALFGNGNLFRKNIGPKKIIWDTFGYNPRRHHTRGSEKNAT